MQKPLLKTVSGWHFVLAAASIMLITTGARQCAGLFVSPLNSATGFGIVNISFALAIGQLVWGTIQPVFGVFADRHGPVWVIIFGALLIAVGMAATPFVSSPTMLVVTFGVISAAGSGAGSFSILLGAAAQRLPAERRGMAAGVINSGGSMGQFVYARVAQSLIEHFGWVSAMISVGCSAVLTIPLAFLLRRESKVVPVVTARGHATPAAEALVPTPSLKRDVKRALSDRSFWLLAAGFFTCGFHIAFLVVHLPGEVALCGLSASVAANSLALIGLFNVVGSLLAGWLCSRVRLKYLLSGMYLSRAVLIVIYLASPHTALTFYLFAAALGATWLATVPPTAGLVGKLFGARYFATLFGLVLFAHQVGGFFGAWLGGLVLRHFGNYSWMWYTDIVLAIGAGLINLPIREAKLEPALA
jgi:MFS family permease